MTMIEQVARGLCAAKGPDGFPLLGLDPDYDDRPEAEKDCDEGETCKHELRLLAKAALSVFEPNDTALRAFYEAQCPPGEMPIGGFSRWATWEEARASRAPEIKKCLRAMIAAVLTENPE